MGLLNFIKRIFRKLFPRRSYIDCPVLVVPEGMTVLPLNATVEAGGQARTVEFKDRKPVQGPGEFRARIRGSEEPGGTVTLTWAELPAEGVEL